MDKIKEFILQCKMAVEIQKDYPKNPRIGDRVYKTGYEYTSIIIGLDEYYDDETWKVKLNDDFAYEDTRDLIWLPSQERLQEMVVDKKDIRIWKTNLIGKFYKFCQDMNMFYNSMEQLWLAFVMKEKYNKTWDGKDWVQRES